LAAGIFIWRKEKNGTEVKKSADSHAKTAQSADENISSTVKTYTDPQLGFAFDYPDNFKIKASSEGDQDAITINGEDGKNGLQILVVTMMKRIRCLWR